MKNTVDVIFIIPKTKTYWKYFINSLDKGFAAKFDDIIKILSNYVPTNLFLQAKDFILTRKPFLIYVTAKKIEELKPNKEANIKNLQKITKNFNVNRAKKEINTKKEKRNLFKDLSQKKLNF